MTSFPAKIARAAGTRGQRSGRMLPGLRPRAARDRALARLHAAGEPDGAGRRGAAAAAVVSHQPVALRQVRPGAARPGGRSRHHLPAGISLHQRHDQAAARQFRRALCRSVGHAEARPHDLVDRHRLERRHAAVEFPERRPPRARHRADRRGQDRQRAAASRRSRAISRRRWRAEVKGEHGAGARGHGGELLRAYRGRACDRRRHSATCWRPTACSSRNRTISSGCWTGCNTTPSITSICATIRSTASPTCLQMHGLEVFHARPIPTHGGSIRVYAARARHAAGQRQRRADARRRAARRGDARAARRPSATT